MSDQFGYGGKWMKLISLKIANIVTIIKDVIDKAYEMGIKESMAKESMDDLNKYTISTLNGQTMFIGDGPFIRILKNFACNKLKNMKIQSNRIPWISSEEFYVTPKVWIMNKNIKPIKKLLIER